MYSPFNELMEKIHSIVKLIFMTPSHKMLIIKFD